MKKFLISILFVFIGIFAKAQPYLCDTAYSVLVVLDTTNRAGVLNSTRPFCVMGYIEFECYDNPENMQPYRKISEFYDETLSAIEPPYIILNYLIIKQ